MEAVYSSEKLDQSQQVTWYTNPKYSYHFNNCSENLKTYTCNNISQVKPCHDLLWDDTTQSGRQSTDAVLPNPKPVLELNLIWPTDHMNRHLCSNQLPPQHVTSCHNIHMPPHCLSVHDDLLTHYNNGHSVTIVFKCTSILGFFLQKSDTHFTSAVQYLLCYYYLYKCLCTANTNLNKLVISSCQNNMRLATSKNRLKQIKIRHYHTAALMT